MGFPCKATPGKLASAEGQRMLTPTERQAIALAALEAENQLLRERLFYVVAALAAANAKLGITEYQTMPVN